MVFQDKNYWSLILGGSSGFGLATAKKLSSMGMNIFIIHRDRKGSMQRIEEDFLEIKKNGVQFSSLNIDALSPNGIKNICDELQNLLGSKGKLRLLMHSIAFGNLKLIAPKKEELKEVLFKKLGKKLNSTESDIKQAINEIFEEGEFRFADIIAPPKYNNTMFINDEDIQDTIYAMGSSLLTYTQHIYQKKIFASDARVIGMTSEGNEVAWRGYAAVSAAKVVLESVARSIALEFAPFGLRANIVQAGVTNTPALRLIPGNQQLMANAKKRNPFKRLTTPQDVANVISLLTTDEASWINGSVIRVDGGERIVGA